MTTNIEDNNTSIKDILNNALLSGDKQKINTVINQHKWLHLHDVIECCLDHNYNDGLMMILTDENINMPNLMAILEQNTNICKTLNNINSTTNNKYIDDILLANSKIHRYNITFYTKSDDSKFVSTPITNAHNSEFGIISKDKNWRLDIVKWLINNGADIHTSDDDVLINFAENNVIDIVKYLAENFEFDQEIIETVLINSSINGTTTITKYFFEKYANIITDDCIMEVQDNCKATNNKELLKITSNMISQKNIQPIDYTKYNREMISQNTGKPTVTIE